MNSEQEAAVRQFEVKIGDVKADLESATYLLEMKTSDLSLELKTEMAAVRAEIRQAASRLTWIILLGFGIVLAVTRFVPPHP